MDIELNLKNKIKKNGKIWIGDIPMRERLTV